MDTYLQFTFRAKEYACVAFIDKSRYPYYIFSILTDKDLIAEFGDEITVKTDGQDLLPKRDDLPELVKLRRSIFDAVKERSGFVTLRDKIKQVSVLRVT